MDSLVVASALFYVEGAREGDLVCPECRTLPRNGSRSTGICLDHGFRGVRLVPYVPPKPLRPPERDDWDRD
ncbi:MAG: hypothetical protein HY974_02235 [Candidatus Kerfeldbacteria bacterium]|nr:hypothetical protein [Candidatus Kerfeldbacteria bacterium]